MGTEQTDREFDFFVSFTGADRDWARWIAWHLEDAGFRVFFQDWDIGPGRNFVS